MASDRWKPGKRFLFSFYLFPIESPPFDSDRETNNLQTDTEERKQETGNQIRATIPTPTENEREKSGEFLVATHRRDRLILDLKKKKKKKRKEKNKKKEKCTIRTRTRYRTIT